ncbi:MAG: hypothetical protein JNL89_14780, partial [Rhodanobacteraceae bacterium]|nr:hypothetical protein [Rhodanobacteraceae bacterium]
SSPAFQIAPGFAVPFVLCEHPDPVGLNERLRSLFLQREQAGERYANPQPLVQRNEALWESNFQLFDWPDRPVAELRDYCWQQLYRAIGELNGYTRDELLRLHIGAESWFHITRKGGYFALHNHPMASWSGVYCVAAGDDRSGIEDSGLLSFVSPMAANTMYIDMAIARMGQPYAYGPRNFKLKAGQLVLFPSWVLHEVRPYFGEGERITVAFNARFRMVGVEPGKVPIQR